MITYHKLKDEALDDGYCRNCLNRLYGLSLVPSNCLYNAFPDECSCCKKVSNIVVKLRNSGRIKLMKAHKRLPSFTLNDD